MYKIVTLVFTIILLNYLLGNEVVSASSRKRDNKYMIVGGFIPKDPYAMGKYIVSVRLNEVKRFFGTEHLCSGTIISVNAVLTAAHCLVHPDKQTVFQSHEIFVVTGTLERLVPNDNTRIYGAAKLIQHANFTKRNSEDDIAIIKTKANIEMITGFTEVIPLAKVEPEKYSRCYIFGWGRMWTDGPIPNECLFVELELWTKEECAEVYIDFNPPKMACAGTIDNNQDFCNGDTGGPLLCHGKQYGIISFGEFCGYAIPGGFTDLVYYMSWIQNHM